MSLKEKIFLYLFIIASTVHLASLGMEFYPGVFYSKWILMPLLIAYFVSGYQHIKNYTLINFILLGLFFSFLGDVFLLYDFDGKSIFFLLGLGSFLLGHVSYILGFKRLIRKDQYDRKKFVPSILVLFTIIFLIYLMPAVPNDMKVPILVYALVITLMSIAAYQLKTSEFGKAGILVFVGALFFLLSDCILSISIFRMTSPPTIIRICVMATYILGQFLIATQTKQLYRHPIPTPED